MTKKLALVTGGTRGIGAAIAKSLKTAGYDVAVNYANNHDRAKAFTAETGIKAYSFDVSDFDACAAGVAKIEAELGQKTAILINNAGITRDRMMHKMSAADWQAVLRTNLDSTFNMAHAVIESMRDNKFGRIVSISSINALAGQLGQTNYSAAKSGMIGFTKALALESARKNITVNAVAPGYIATEMTDAIDEKIREQIKSMIPVGRFGQVEEIAHAVLFLVSEHAGFITGETISVNGGQYLN